MLTGAEITKRETGRIKEDMSFFNVFLMVFAVIALFVGSFIIYNTFSILVAQRTKEMALMRAIGASRTAGARVRCCSRRGAVGLIASVARSGRRRRRGGRAEGLLVGDRHRHPGRRRRADEPRR